MYKTFARKYQLSVPKICDKYIVNKMFTVFYKTKKRAKNENVLQRWFQEKKG